MARRMMLKDTRTGRWGWYTVGRLRMPWETAWARLGWALRCVRRHNAPLPYGQEETLYDFDPDTLHFTDRKLERRMRRRDRLERRLLDVVSALFSMIDMQKYIN